MFDKDSNGGEQNRMKRKQYQSTYDLIDENAKKSIANENDQVIDQVEMNYVII